MRSTAIFLALLLGLVGTLRASDLIVHEWGTFTSLQNESGRTMKGIARDVEPLPPLVQNLIPDSDGPKGIPDSISGDVTMRLETPVVYFHLPKGSPPMSVGFSATFNGGVISQWYPRAVNSAPLGFGALSETTRDTLSWESVNVGGPAKFPETTSRIWLAPRNVDAADITTPDGQGERFLFYRGVGKLDAPLKIVRDGDTLRATWQLDPAVPTPPNMRIDRLWYVDIRADGSGAYRTFDHGQATMPADFNETDYSTERVDELKQEMRVSLVAAGLFADEARAMINTWDEGYFKSPGTRVFFIVPRAWTDHYLPIKLTVPAQIERVMMGRIDLITPRQRELARRYREIGNTTSAESQTILRDMGRFSSVIISDTPAR